ncbi:hypothetical protein AVEN_268551-1 [Araneus ventricosus]|uniref:Uncharacterized protein n=1 Tax=Araneus ventricosus TaxID=182803 RepID=A0A4Y2KEQ1_ARAVE|nr:hypothetical protein AVEN_268551-1 [Araneus ventricosus]
MRVGDVQRVMTTGTRVFRHSVPLVFKFWVGRPEDVGSVPLAVLALGSRFFNSPYAPLPMSSSTKTGGEDPVIYVSSGIWTDRMPVLEYNGCEM